MATKARFNDARIRYTPPSAAELTHLLGAKLIELRVAHGRERHDWWAGSKKDRETVTIGDGVTELLATIRYDDEPAALKTMLRHGLEDNVTLIYQLEEGGTEYPVKLVRVISEAVSNTPDHDVPITPDRDTWRLGEWEARLHLRRIDGGNLDDLL